MIADSWNGVNLQMKAWPILAFHKLLATVTAKAAQFCGADSVS